VGRFTPAAGLLVAVVLAAGSCDGPLSPSPPPAPAPEDPPLPEGPPVIHSTDPANVILDRAVEALGGPGKLARWHCGRVRYETRSDVIFPLDRKPALVEEFFSYPGHLRRVTEVGEGARRQTVISLVNGDEGWEYWADGSARLLPQETILSVLRGEHAFADFCNLPRLRSGFFRLSVLGEEQVHGRDAVVLRAESDFANLTDYAFDCSTALLVRSLKHLPQPGGGEKVVETRLGDYHDFGGSPVPRHVVGSCDGTVLLEFRLLEVEFSDTLPEGLFAPP
jgi:hypothetical protein